MDNTLSPPASPERLADSPEIPSVASGATLQPPEDHTITAQKLPTQTSAAQAAQAAKHCQLHNPRPDHVHNFIQATGLNILVAPSGLCL